MKTLPAVWETFVDDIIIDSMRTEAERLYTLHSIIPSEPERWQKRKTQILSKLSDAFKLNYQKDLPLDPEVTGVIRRDHYRIEKVCFQAAENRYVTGCLYVPDGDGPFPAVLNVHGHWMDGHLAERVQTRGHILAQHGYVCLSVDAFGSGERCTEHGKFDPHGGFRGMQLNNFGETLIGIQIDDNRRAVDFLCSLPYVDPEKIGVTGASGGGNQTMYLTVFEDRIKAGVSVCSVGSFRSYVMGSNCICETIDNGMNICEESELIACIAPRSFLMCNGFHDQYSTFVPEEMLKTYTGAKKIFQMYNVPNQLQYRIFNTIHLYGPEALSNMLGFFDFYLKGEGACMPVLSLPECDFMTREEAMVYPDKRPDKLKGIFAYCQTKREKVRAAAASLNDEQKRAGLKKVLNCKDVTFADYSFGDISDIWQRIVIRKANGDMMPALLKPSRNGKWQIMSGSYGKQKQLENSAALEEACAGDDGLLLIDITASGETGKEYGCPTQWDYHHTARTFMWFGRPLLGEWTQDYHIAAQFLKAEFEVTSLTFYGFKDAGVAALLASAIYGGADKVVMDHSLASLDWADTYPDVTDFTMAMSVTDILKYGDIADYKRLAAPAEIVTIGN